MSVELVFLGTGGGRFATITQRRMTGGILLNCEKRIHIDPGPGALIRAIQFGYNPIGIDGIIVSHCHPDHYTDAEVMIEAMTRGMTKRHGFLIGSKSVIEGYKNFGPSISKYHQKQVEEIYTVEPDQTLDLGNMTIEVTPTIHSDPSGVGFKFFTENGIISYIGDTEYFDDISKYHEGARVLIVPNTRPSNDRIKYHLCSEDTIKLLREIKPEKAFLIHLGMKIMDIASKEAKIITEKSGVETIAPNDGAKISVEEVIKVDASRQGSLDSFLR
ncbi:MAG: MBL fold metallo-hydrolase [Candidatus Hydrothermarchaeota archaeon]